MLRKENNDDVDILGGKVGVVEFCIMVSEGEFGDIIVGIIIVKEFFGDIVIWVVVEVVGVDKVLVFDKCNDEDFCFFNKIVLEEIDDEIGCVVVFIIKCEVDCFVVEGVFCDCCGFILEICKGFFVGFFVVGLWYIILVFWVWLYLLIFYLLWLYLNNVFFWFVYDRLFN